MDLKAERMLVTGGAGFLGRRVCHELVARGVPAENIVVPRSREFDLTREADVARLFDVARPTVVLHLAAEVGGIGANRANPGRFFFANMAMGLHLIERSRLCGVRKFVQVGTICAYPKFTPVPFREDDLWAGYPEETNAPYGVAKKALLVMLQAYRQQYGLNGIYLLPVNLYGPGDNFDPASSHVIPALIRKFQEAIDTGRDAVTVWGTGAASREFLYVDDAARAIVLATERYDGPEPVNVGAGFEITIRDLALKLKDISGFQGQLQWDDRQPDGQPRRCLDTTRARSAFGFSAEVGFDEGLRRTVQWWRGGSRGQPSHRHPRAGSQIPPALPEVSDSSNHPTDSAEDPQNETQNMSDSTSIPWDGKALSKSGSKSGSTVPAVRLRFRSR